jgi:hypothetical protein
MTEQIIEEEMERSCRINGWYRWLRLVGRGIRRNTGKRFEGNFETGRGRCCLIYKEKGTLSIIF